MNIRNQLRSIGLCLACLIGAGLILIGCSDAPMTGTETSTDGSFSVSTSSSSAAVTQSQGRANSATVYRARLTPLGGSGVQGEVKVSVQDDNLRVNVNARGLEASVEHAQHFHENGTCSPPGAPIISLDDDIANAPGDATNADPGDDSFPTATPGGTVNYQQTASKSAVMNALGGDLDLENRTVVVHKAGTPIGGAAACGELNEVSN